MQGQDTCAAASAWGSWYPEEQLSFDDQTSGFNNSFTLMGPTALAGQAIKEEWDEILASLVRAVVHLDTDASISPRF
jgi:hypothetical protein